MTADSQALIELGNRRIIELVGVFFVLSDHDRWAWLRANGWRRDICDHWRNDALGEFATMQDVPEREIKRALFQPQNIV